MKKAFVYLVVVTIILGMYWIRLRSVQPHFKDGDTIKISGMLSEEPKTYGQMERVVIGSFSGFVKAPTHSQYGDTVEMTGTANSTKYGWSIENAKFTKINTHSSILFAYSLKENILAFYSKVLPPTHASLLAGIVLGTKSSLDPTFFNQLRSTGTLHVVVASGTNISLLAGAILSSLVGWINRRWAIALSLLVIWLYILLVGWQAPVVRAGIMASIAFLAQGIGREVNATKVLLVAGVLMLFLNPLWLFDVGFQLSFLATIGVVWIGPFILQRLSKVPSLLKNDLATSLGAQIAVSPIILLQFGQVSWSAPLVNPVILWTIPPIMIGGMVLGFLSFLGTPGEMIGQAFAWFLWLPLEYFLKVVQVFGGSS